MITRCESRFHGPPSRSWGTSTSLTPKHVWVRSTVKRIITEQLLYQLSVILSMGHLDRCNEASTSTDHDTRSTRGTSARSRWGSPRWPSRFNAWSWPIGVNVDLLSSITEWLSFMVTRRRQFSSSRFSWFASSRARVASSRFHLVSRDWGETEQAFSFIPKDVPDDDTVDSVAWNLDSILIGEVKTSRNRRTGWSSGIS